MSWTEHAACKGVPTQWFFPGLGQYPAEAAELCGICPVRTECGEHADVLQLLGVWGGANRTLSHGGGGNKKPGTPGEAYHATGRLRYHKTPLRDYQDRVDLRRARSNRSYRRRAG